jgi:probable rRNA maturation factor
MILFFLFYICKMKKISFTNHQAPAFTFKNRTIVKQWLEKTMHQYGYTSFEIAYIFSNDEYVLGINQQFLQHDFYTDIITFDYSTKQKIESEIYISIDRVKDNAAQLSITFNEELHRVIAHGVLHLCGLKDKTKPQQTAMRNAENNALLLLQKMIKK